MKLPVTKALTSTFSFVFGNFIDVIKIMWLPGILLAAIVGYFAHTMFSGFHQMTEVTANMDPENPDPAAVLQAMGPLMAAQGLILLAELILLPMIYTGLLRLVVRGEKPGLVYFRFGGDELRVLLTMILKGLLIAAIFIGGIMVVGLAGGLLRSVSESAAVIGGVVLGCALLILMIWILLRLSLSLPGAIGAKGIGIGPSWSATKGAVWSLLLYWLLWSILIGLAQNIILAFVLPDFIGQMIQFSQTVQANPDDPHAAMQAMAALQEQMFAMLSARMPFLIGIAAFFLLVVYPLMISAGGMAYKYLTGGETEAEEA